MGRGGVQLWRRRGHRGAGGLRGDARDRPVLSGHTPADIKTFTEATKEHERIEELRLAYVAWTRARHRLRVTTPYDVDETKDAIPITLDGLEKWDVGDRLVRDVLSGGDPRAAMLAEQLWRATSIIAGHPYHREG